MAYSTPGPKARSAACAAVIALLASCAMFGGGEKHTLVKGGVFFTKVNMWYARNGEIHSTNYHLGEILPAGTRVTVGSCRGGKVKFESEAGGKYTLVHATRHSRLSLAELFDRHFGRSDVTSSIGIYSDLSPREQASVVAFSRAVHELADCYPLLKPRLLKAMATAAGTDGGLCPVEREIVASVAAVMDCPVPLLDNPEQA